MKKRHRWNKKNTLENYQVECIDCGIIRYRPPSPIKYKDYIYFFDSKKFIFFKAPNCKPIKYTE